MRTCSIGGCEKNVYARNLCAIHYRRLLRSDHTDPKPPKPPSKHRSESGYVYLIINKIRRTEHVAIAMKALGKELPKGAEVHHVNGIRHDNRPENLVICPNASYHDLIEVRTKAFEACGNADYRKCWICKQYDDPSNISKNSSHSKCWNELQKEKRKRAPKISAEEAYRRFLLMTKNEK